MNARKVLGGLAAAALAAAVGREAMADENCPQSHCSQISDKMNKFCVQNGFAGEPFLVIGPGNLECFCPCSCVTPDTLVTYSDNTWHRIEVSKVGDMLLGPFTEDGAGRLDKRLMSTVEDSSVLRLRFSSGVVIVASPNHPFVLPDEIVASARTLHPGDLVLDASFQPVGVLSVEDIDDFTGELHNLIVNDASTAAQDHLVVTNGILSGDWLLQANNDQVERSIALRTGTIDLFDGREEP